MSRRPVLPLAGSSPLRSLAWRSLALSLAALLIVTPAVAQPAGLSWGEWLKRDARALHDTYKNSHPGAVDPENPEFARQLEAGLSRALHRASSVDSYGGYWWALREYVASFNDGHVLIDKLPGAPEPNLRWPGFLTRQIAGRHVVVTGPGRPDAPPQGASLISCNGVPADEVSRRLVGQFRGRWGMTSQHDQHSWRLFLDADNPYVTLPSRCRFSVAGTEREYILNWVPLSGPEFQRESQTASQAYRTATGVRPFGARGLWISAGSFDGNTSTLQGRQISELLASLRSQKALIASADRIVLDVRGNGGGSSRWGNDIAELIWGRKVAAAAKPQSSGVDWRPSAANIAAIEDYVRGPGTGFFARMFMARIVSGLKSALAAGQPLWREKSPTSTRKVPGSPVSTGPGGKKVYILADGGCASACLDAMDVWTAAGAIPIGRETAADSPYMEIRRQQLPSGLSIISVPMKVYRGRPRGANVPFRPVHRFDGDMRDEAALQAWIAGLP